MLNITVSSHGESHLTFSLFEEFEIPAPPNGADQEINNDVILRFEDEEDAIAYAGQLESMAGEINDKTTLQYMAVNDIITAIVNDEFVQSYSR